MKWIESRIVEIGDELTQPITTKEELLRLNDEILNVASRINGFRVKLGENKDKISSEDYNNYLDRLNDAEANLVDLNNQLKQTVIEEKNNEYDQMMLQLNNLDREVTITLNYINSLQGKVTIEAGSVFEGELEIYAARLDDMKKEIEDKYNSSN